MQRLADAGYSNNGHDSGWEKDGFTVYIGDKQIPDDKTCSGTASGTHTGAIGDPLIRTLSHKGYKVHSAKGNAARTTIRFSAHPGTFDALIEPGPTRQSARIVISKVN